MPYRIQTKLHSGEWVDVPTSGGLPFEYQDRSVAEEIVRLCWGNNSDDARVIDVMAVTAKRASFV
jgi:hypothetical protein